MNHQKSNLVSVVITCYNQARFLGETIESVLTQTRRNFEVVVVDDGSQDDSAGIVSAFAGVRYIRQANQGVVAARNHGLRESSGDYVVFLDGDDRLLPHALETGRKHLDAHPEYAFVYGHSHIINADGSLQTPAPPLRVEKGHYAELLKNNYIWMPAMAMHRRAHLMSAGGFDAAADHASDYDLYLRLTRKHPVYCHGEAVAAYRVHGGNTSHQSEKMLTSTLTVHRSQWKYIKGNTEYEEAYKKGLRHWQIFYGEPVIDKLRRLLEERYEWKRIGHTVLTLARYYPQGLASHGYIKLRNMIWRQLF